MNHCGERAALPPLAPSVPPPLAQGAPPTLLRLITGDLAPDGGTVTVQGGLGVMRQFVGTTGRSGHESATLAGDATVRDLLVSGRRPPPPRFEVVGPLEEPPRDQRISTRLRAGGRECAP